MWVCRWFFPQKSALFVVSWEKEITFLGTSILECSHCRPLTGKPGGIALQVCVLVSVRHRQWTWSAIVSFESHETLWNKQGLKLGLWPLIAVFLKICSGVTCLRITHLRCLLKIRYLGLIFRDFWLSKSGVGPRKLYRSSSELPAFPLNFLLQYQF